MDEKDGNGTESGTPGNPFVGNQLCIARRATLDQKITSLRNQIIGAIGLSTAILLLVSYIK